MIEKKHLLEKDEMWLSPNEEMIYTFIDEESGYYRDEKNEQEGAFKWAFNEDKKIIKIVFPEEQGGEKTFYYKFLVNEDNNYLFKKYNSDKQLVDDVVFIKERLETPVSYKTFKDMDMVDKIVFFILGLLTFCLIVLTFAFTPIINGFSGIFTFIFGILFTVLLSKKIMSLSLLISQRHKTYLESLFYNDGSE